MLKVGVIGVGSISEFNIKPYLKNDQVELLALCDLNEERLAEKGALYGVSELYSDYHELLKNKEIDAVSICTWNNSHAEIAVAALEAGKNVLVEKPLSMTVDEALQIEAAVERTGKIEQVGFVRRHGDNTKLFKTFIDNDEYGENYYVSEALRKYNLPVSAYDVTNNFVKELSEERAQEVAKIQDGIKVAK